MIRLTSLNDNSKKSDTQNESPSPNKLKSHNASPQIRLRPKRRRISTMQAESQIDSSYSHPVRESFRLPFFGQRLLDISDQYGREEVTKTFNLEQKVQGTAFTSETSKVGFLLNGLTECERESPQKQGTGKQIVKLKHRKHRPQSPIDKLVPLLNQSPALSNNS